MADNNERASVNTAETEISALLESYIDAFNRQDFESALKVYSLPCTFLTAQGIFVLKSEDEFLATMRSTSAALRKKGLTKSVFTHKQVRLLDTCIALVSVECVRSFTKGPVTIGGLYNLHRGEHGWQIVTIMTLQTPISITVQDGSPDR